MKNNTKNTGEKLIDLEELGPIQALYRVIHHEQDFDQLSFQGLKLIKDALLKKSQDSDSHLSNAHYSAIHFYREQSQLKIHSGANIDPSSYELFKSRKHRNCAEKQAALSAAREGLNNSTMQIMFLYREPELTRKFPAEKLLPCRDCYDNYIQDLIEKDGHLVLILSDNEDRKFLTNTNANNHIETAEVDGQKIYYKIFTAKQMRFLNIEMVLGGRVCAEGH